MKILIVDNNDVVQKICAFVFEKLGHEVQVAGSGFDALRLLSETRFDFVFLELFLRDMSGLTILEKLKNQEVLSVIMTGYHSVELIKKAVELGASSYMFKPIDPDSLEATLVMCLKRSELDKIRTEAKQKLIESQQKYKTLVDGILEGIAMVQGGKIRFINKAMANLLGLNIPHVINKKLKEIFVSRDKADRVYRRMVQFIDEGIPIEGNYGFRNFNGKNLTLFVSANKTNFQNRAADMFVFNDITERIEVTKKMKKIEERYRIIHEHASDAFFLIDQDGVLQEANRISEAMLGYTKEELMEMNMNDLIVEEDAERFILLFNELRNLGGIPPSEIHMKKKNGKQLIASMSAVFIDFNSYLLILYDITDRKKDAGRIAEIESHYKTLLDNIPGVVYKSYPNATMGFMSEGVKDFTGYEKSEFVSGSVNWENLIVKEDWDMIRDAVNGLRANDNKRVIDYRIRDKRNMIHWVRDYVSGLFDDLGTLVAYEGIIFDITEQKLVDVRLNESERKYRALIQNLPVVVYSIIFKGGFHVEYVSPFVQDLLGYTPEEVNEKNVILSNIFDDDREEVEKTLKKYTDNGKGDFRLEYRMLDSNGRVLYVVNRGTVIKDGLSGIHVEGTIVDVTPLKQTLITKGSVSFQTY